MAARKSSKSRRAPPVLPRAATYSLHVAVDTSDSVRPPQKEFRREIRPSNLFRLALRARGLFLNHEQILNTRAQAVAHANAACRSQLGIGQVRVRPLGETAMPE